MEVSPSSIVYHTAICFRTPNAEYVHSYPYLVTINTLLPALIAGNTVVLKPSPQTPLVGERFEKIWQRVLQGAGIESQAIIQVCKHAISRDRAVHPVQKRCWQRVSIT